MDLDLSDYRSAIDALFARTAGQIKPGLERIEALLTSLGDPHQRYPSFHVAGTNGKGSVCATLDTLLQAKGLRVGRYTSPHLIDFRERIQVNGVAIDEATVVAFLQRVWYEASAIGATFFEVTTAMAFWYFAEQGVDVAVLETGLGGRFDATNVVTPLVSAVTNISFDHAEYLGPTLFDIANEKAGVFKAGCGAVIGEPMPDLARHLTSRARERRASPLTTLRADWRSWSVSMSGTMTSFTAATPMGEHRFSTALYGEHQVRNTLTAMAMLWAAGGMYQMPAVEINKALKGVFLPGRFQRVGEWIFDVAHNPDGARALARALVAAARPKPTVALIGVLKDKEWHGVLEALAPEVDRFIITQPATVPADRAWDPMEAAIYANRLKVPVDLDWNFDVALDRAQNFTGTKVVAGSFHTVGDAMQRLGIDPLTPLGLDDGAASPSRFS